MARVILKYLGVIFDKLNFTDSWFEASQGAVHRRSLKQVFLKISQYSRRKNLSWSLFLMKLIKKRLQQGCFPVNIF